MKIAPSLAALAACLGFSLALPTLAASPVLDIPNFNHLREKASDSTDITLDGFLLRLASKFAQSAGTPQNEQERLGLELLSGIRFVQVRNFTFDSDDVYSQADIDKVRKQVAAPGWSQLVQVRKREPRENVDVYLCMENDKVKGLAVIASEPRQFTIVNIVGTIDIDSLSALEGQFGVPKLSQNQ
jgi:hypothetical protein